VNDIVELISQVCRTGASMYAEPPDIVITSPKRVPLELKAKLRERKRDVLSYLELQASMERLETTGICIAVFEDGEMRVIVRSAETDKTMEKAAIYSPSDMFHYVQLEQDERHMLHDFKKRFGGTTEWRGVR
jgi:hypothetical protein